MSLLLIAFDTFFKGIVFIGVYFVGRYFIKEALNGFPSFYVETEWEVEEDVKDCRDFACGKCHACESYTAYQNGEYK